MNFSNEVVTNWLIGAGAAVLILRYLGWLSFPFGSATKPTQPILLPPSNPILTSDGSPVYTSTHQWNQEVEVTVKPPGR